MPSTIKQCFSTVIDPDEQLARQFSNYLFGAITDYSDILIINPSDGLIKIQEDLNIAIQLLEITYPESLYIKFDIEYDSATDEMEFIPLNEFTDKLTDIMQDFQ